MRRRRQRRLIYRKRGLWRALGDAARVLWSVVSAAPAGVATRTGGVCNLSGGQNGAGAPEAG